MLPIPRPIRPNDFEIIAQLPGIAAVARDQDLRVFWCTPSFYRINKNIEGTQNMIGTTLADMLPETSAKERSKVHHHVMETGQTQSHYQFSVDSRVLCTIFPLDEEAFGHRGVFVIIKNAPIKAGIGVDQNIQALSTPNLFILNTLSARELEVLYFVATGLKTSEIAGHISRATKTVEHHINSIHKKLKTQSRAQLVQFASERGIQSFTIEEWASIVKGARIVRLENIRAKAETEAKPLTDSEIKSDN